MEKTKSLAATIIDHVEDAIRKAHPWISYVAENFISGNTLLTGEDYYNLEDEVKDLIEGMRWET